MKDKNKQIAIQQSLNMLKSGGITVSRRNLRGLANRAYKENESLIAEAEREQTVLRMKRHYEYKGWTFPPKTMVNATSVHLINEYYGKEVCKHTPEDKMETTLKKLNGNN